MDDGDGFDDLPSTHLDDDEYNEYLAREFDSVGGVKGDPPVGLWIGILIAILVAIACAVAL